MVAARTRPGMVWMGQKWGRRVARTLKFKSSYSGAGIVCQCLRLDVRTSFLVFHSAVGKPALSYFSFTGQNGGVTFNIFIFQGEVATFRH